MIKFIDMTGKTEDEAIRRALEQLGLEREVRLPRHRRLARNGPRQL